jgi:hypothetical protein
MPPTFYSQLSPKGSLVNSYPTRNNRVVVRSHNDKKPRNTSNAPLKLRAMLAARSKHAQWILQTPLISGMGIRALSFFNRKFTHDE